VQLSIVDRFTWIVHTLLVGGLLWRHEPWRDELQAWSIALTSETPLDLFPNTRLEGRPPGWQMLLWPFAQVISNPRMLQVVTLVIGAIAAWWWLKLSDLDWRIKALVLFGFHFTGGYSVHSRDYILSFLVLVAAVGTYRRHGTGLRLAAVLSIFSFVNAFSLAMAGAFVAAAWLPALAQLLKVPLRRRLEIISALVICTTLFALATYLTYPTNENQWQIGTYKGFGRMLTKSFIPLDYEWQWLMRIDDWLGALILLGILAYAWSKSVVAFLFAAFSFSMLLYNLTFGYGDYWWHFGNATIVAFTLTCFPPTKTRLISHHRIARVGMLTLLIVALINLVAQRFGPGRDVYSDRPYSMASAAAKQIKEICGGCTVIVDWDAVGAAISTHLDGRELLYLNRGEFGTFAKFSNTNIQPTWDQAIAAMNKFDRPLLVQTIFLSGPAPNNLNLIGIHLDGVWDTNLIWQLETKPLVNTD
jgi:hypothetical protein